MKVYNLNRAPQRFCVPRVIEGIAFFPMPRTAQFHGPGKGVPLTSHTSHYAPLLNLQNVQHVVDKARSLGWDDQNVMASSLYRESGRFGESVPPEQFVYYLCYHDVTMFCNALAFILNIEPHFEIENFTPAVMQSPEYLFNTFPSRCAPRIATLTEWKALSDGLCEITGKRKHNKHIGNTDPTKALAYHLVQRDNTTELHGLKAENHPAKRMSGREVLLTEATFESRPELNTVEPPYVKAANRLPCYAGPHAPPSGHYIFTSCLFDPNKSETDDDNDSMKIVDFNRWSKANFEPVTTVKDTGLSYSAFEFSAQPFVNIDDTGNVTVQHRAIVIAQKRPDIADS